MPLALGIVTPVLHLNPRFDPPAVIPLKNHNNRL
jgi:hypothetical protein